MSLYTVNASVTVTLFGSNDADAADAAWYAIEAAVGDREPLNLVGVSIERVDEVPEAPQRDENAKLWVEALRSGRYKQGMQYLAAENENGTVEYCCLGVACELYRDAGNPLARTRRDNYGDPSVIYFYGDEGDADNEITLPEPVMKWLGLRTPAGDIDGRAGLAGLNDAGASFERIAEIIESQPAGLFAS